MVHTPEAVLQRDERAEQRRQQVLTAAEVCFRVEGFHGTSMGRIAAEAGMSVGHIYKYFESKEMIIATLSERHFAELMLPLIKVIDAQAHDHEALITAVLDGFSLLSDRGAAAMLLEVLAEAGRNPKIGEMVSRLDRQSLATMRGLLLMVNPDEKSLDAKAEALALLIQGIAMRAISNPDVEPSVRRAGFEAILRSFLTSVAQC